MRFSSLGSGSEGNCWLFSDADPVDPSLVMVDCGFATKEAVARLERVGVKPEAITGIVVTHEHGDHVSGVFKFSRKFNTPVYLTHGTWQAALRSKHSSESYLETGLVSLIESHSSFSVGKVLVDPFPVPHDAREPIQMLLKVSGFTAGILTDCGHATPHMLDKLSEVDALVLESNHCPQMLAQSPYPESLKRRVGGHYGHLSNQVACQILHHLKSKRLKYVVAAHLSRNTNCPDLVSRMWAEVLEPAGVPFGVACQDNGFEWWDLGAAAMRSQAAA